MSDLASHVSPGLPPGQWPSPRADFRPPEPLEPRLRLWPAVVVLALLWAVRLLPGWLELMPLMQFMLTFWGPVLCTALLVAWWVFFSRVRWADVFLTLAVLGGAGAAALPLADPSVNIFLYPFYALPLVLSAWVGWLVVSRPLSWPVRRWGLVVVLLAAWACVDVVRFQGVDGSFRGDFAWRWSLTAEQRYLAELSAAKPQGEAPAWAASAVVVEQDRDWPGFRGPNRDSRLHGVKLATDWGQKPPRELWRHRIGPAWSSFAVVGKRLYTQEQLGTEEAVVCYDADTGSRLWWHKYEGRFQEPVSGAGPRATPTIHQGKVYALGAAGKLSCLDAVTGEPVWSRDIAADSGAKAPIWGFSSSPLVLQGIVTVFAGGPDGKSVVGYHADSGELAWSAGEGQGSYCSPQRAVLAGVEQVLLTTEKGLSAFHPTTGAVLWKHDWPVEGPCRVTQPAVLDGSDVLIGTPFTGGLRRLRVTRDGDNWSVQEVWTTRTIKPYFSDLVIHNGHLYGFDNAIFTCVRLEDGKGRWRARGYDNGQVLLLADQGLLLIQAEYGDVALVEANPNSHKELARIPALDKKTWNHPVVANGKLFVRNDQWIACYQLEPAGQ
jgi:outer membrane protein assembly factor BamB